MHYVLNAEVSREFHMTVTRLWRQCQVIKVTLNRHYAMAKPGELQSKDPQLQECMCADYTIS